MKKTINIYSIVLVLFCSCTENSPTIKSTIESSKQFITHKDGVLYDTNKEQIQLKGTNLGNWLVPEGYMFKTGKVNSPRKIDELLREMIGPTETDLFWSKHLDTYIQREDIAYLKKTGCNHIRLPFHYRLFTDQPYLGTQNAGFNYIDRVVEWCKQEGIYLLLDMHCAPGGQTGDNIDDSYGYPYLYESESCQKQFIEIWERIAKRYQHETIIVGYDLVNEPIAHYFEKDISRFETTLVDLYNRTIKAIREKDKEHLIFVNGSKWSTSFDLFDPVFKDNKIVYEFHKYWMDPIQSEVQDYVNFRDKHNVPIYIGETGENTDEWVNTFRELLDTNEINWCFWPYKKMDNPKGIMNFDLPKNYSLISQYAASNRSSYKDIRNNTPQRDSVLAALNTYIQNSQFKNCYPNKGYCNGLNLSID